MGRGRAARLLSIGLLLLVAACARPTGDFGRAEQNVLNDEIMPRIGNLRAKGSSFNYADQESEMRDRVWRYLVAPHAHDWFGDVAVEFQRTRIVPMSSKPLDRTLYYKWLHGTRFASSRVRYARIGEDTVADNAMVPSAFAAICAVMEIDRQRGIASNAIGDIEEDVLVNAARRQAENRDVIDWFVRALRHRYESYSYALDRLLVETPHEEAVGANAGLNEMALHVEAAERGDFCTDPRRNGRSATRAIASRYERPVVTEGPYRK